MTAEQFNLFWTSNYPATVLMQHTFRDDYAHRWFRIHSLPESKRYAEDEQEWTILLDRQNKIITELLGDNSPFILVAGEYGFKDHTEPNPPEVVNSIKDIHFVSLEPIDLYKLKPDEYLAGQIYTPLFSEQVWEPQKFDNLLRDIANDQLRAFFVSAKKECIVAPYDGGIDLILKDRATRNFYKEKYAGWLSARQDGL